MCITVPFPDSRVNPSIRLKDSWHVVFVVNALVFRQHALMQDSGNEDTSGFLPVKDNMLALLHATHAWTNMFAGTPKGWIVRKQPAAIFQLAEVALSLGCTPGVERIVTDVVQILVRAA
jgi:hypothetical protein